MKSPEFERWIDDIFLDLIGDGVRLRRTDLRAKVVAAMPCKVLKDDVLQAFVDLETGEH
jgi:hypothetical protein